MFLTLVNILAVLVAQESAFPLGAPTTGRLSHTRPTVIYSTALQTETVPVAFPFVQEAKETGRKASVKVKNQMFTKIFPAEENPVTIPEHMSVNNKLQRNDDDTVRSREKTADTSSAYKTPFQSSSINEPRSLEELLNLARIKYLGHDLSWKPTNSRTGEKRKPKVRVNTRRNMLIEMNKQRHGLIYAGPGFSRVSGFKVASSSIYGSQEPANNGSDTTPIPAQVQEAKENIPPAFSTRNTVPKTNEEKRAMRTSNAAVPELGLNIHSTVSRDGALSETSRTEPENWSHTTISAARNHLSSQALNATNLIKDPQEETPMRKRMTKLTDIFQLINSNKIQSLVKIHQGRSLLHQPGHLKENIQSIYNDSKETPILNAHRDATKPTPSKVQIDTELSVLSLNNNSEEVSTSKAGSKNAGREFEDIDIEQVDTSTEQTNTNTEVTDTRTDYMETTTTRIESVDTGTDAADTSTETVDTVKESEDTSTESEDTSTESADTSTESANTTTESADTSTDSADTSTDSADTSTESADTSTECAETSTESADVSTESKDISTESAVSSIESAGTSIDYADTGTRGTAFEDTNSLNDWMENTGYYQEANPGQELQLNIEFNPVEETKTYNVHKRTGDYIIGEVGRINVNNGQTLEGVRYTAVDGMVNQAQIAEIIKHFFSTKTK